MVLNVCDVGIESSRGASSLIEGELTLLFADIRHARRMMRRTPLFTGAAILTVMLAIGGHHHDFQRGECGVAATAPIPEPSWLVQVAQKNDKLNLPTSRSSILNFVSWEQSQSFQELEKESRLSSSGIQFSWGSL
jgi:hypothetical protein